MPQHLMGLVPARCLNSFCNVDSVSIASAERQDNTEVPGSPIFLTRLSAAN